MKPPTRLRLARIKAGYSQYEVERETGIHQPVLSQYELGTRDPKDEQKKQLAHLYGTSTDELFANEDRDGLPF